MSVTDIPKDEAEVTDISLPTPSEEALTLLSEQEGKIYIDNARVESAMYYALTGRPEEMKDGMRALTRIKEKQLKELGLMNSDDEALLFAQNGAILSMLSTVAFLGDRKEFASWRKVMEDMYGEGHSTRNPLRKIIGDTINIANLRNMEKMVDGKLSRPDNERWTLGGKLVQKFIDKPPSVDILGVDVGELDTTYYDFDLAKL